MGPTDTQTGTHTEPPVASGVPYAPGGGPKGHSELRPLDPSGALELSLIAPAYDEAANLRPLVRDIEAALAGWRYELILVDDGSRDGTDRVIAELAHAYDFVRAVYLPRRAGQSAATLAGFEIARAELVATIDADMQNDPNDIAAMCESLGDYDAVVGYRVQRRDGWKRRATSRFANAVRNRLTGDYVRDTGCSLKLFRASALDAMPRFDGMHRFLPTLLRMHGYSVVEHPVAHRPRAAGRSKYGVRNRALRTLHDVFGIRWMQRRVIVRHEAARRHASC